ncbi:MAG: alpha/beta fold hydrolase [Candidatus Saccharimonas sp.]
MTNDDRREEPVAAVFDAVVRGMYSLFAVGFRQATELATMRVPLAQQTLYRLLSEIWVNTLDPHNTLVGNPEARRKAIETNGQSVLQGLQNFLDDLKNNRGNPALTDLSKFRVGENLAVTPGTVVFRNELLELIHYESVTETVRSVPLLIVPPPINKYYILDLAPGRSLVEKAVAEGQDVYMISWVNPKPHQRNLAFVDDYVVNGVLAAMDFISPDDEVALAGLCLGGTLASIAAAYDGASGDYRVASLSLIVTLTDFGLDTGKMGAMIDQQLVDRVYAQTRRKGVLSEWEMGLGWQLLALPGLYFGPAQKRWLQGEPAPAMDLLAWNADGTRLAAEMHREYLQTCYIDNKFAEGKLVVKGIRVGIGDIAVPVYAVAGTTDHIVPWRSSFAGISQSSGTRRLVLVPRGHIGAIVSVGSRANYFVGPDTYEENWQTAADEHAGSWWSDWTSWLATHSGSLVAPVVDKSDLGPAPGHYVLDTDPLLWR